MGIYIAELRAILKAVQLAKADQIATSTVIFTDSQSVRDSMQKRNTDHPLICKIFHLILQMLSEGKRVEICWVPAHVGITQNERADQGAREAAAADSPITDHRVHYIDYYPVLRKKIHEQWENAWSSTTNNKLRYIKDTVTPWVSSSQKN